MNEPCGKTTYPSRPEAERVLARIRRHPNQREEKPCRTYRCPKCKGWHLTSFTQNKRTRMRK